MAEISQLDRFKAAAKAGYDVDAPPETLTFEQFKSLLVDDVAKDDEKALVKLFIKSVQNGSIAPASKTATGFNWRVRLGSHAAVYQRYPEIPLGEVEIEKAENDEYRPGTVRHWCGNNAGNVASPRRDRREVENYLSCDIGVGRYEPQPRIEITYHFARPHLKAWLKCIEWKPNKLLAAWLESGEPEQQTEAPADKRISQPKESQLHVFIWRVYQFLTADGPKPAAQKVWNEIQHRYKQHDTESIIQEVTADIILWRSGYGNEQRLQRTSFDKTLSKLKKTPPF